MAWRDSRKNRSRLFLFISSIVIGIACLVSLKSFNANLQRAIDTQAAELIGADLELQSRTKPDEKVLAFLDSLGSLAIATASEERFVSMVRFLKDDQSRFVQVRAIEGDFPFYGALGTNPVSAYSGFGQSAEVLIERSLMMLFEAQVGDSTQLGLNRFTIRGELISQPGQSGMMAAMAPTVIVPLPFLKDSGLQQAGSRIEYFYYFKMPTDVKVDDLISSLDDRLRELKLRGATVESTKQRTSRSFGDLVSFMELVGFIALLLGCIGVSSAVHIYVREKLVSVAVLRCLGTTARQAFFIFLTQFAGIGLLGGLLGAIVGSVFQYVIPFVLQDFIPVDLDSQIYWPAVLEGISLGVVIAVLFALLPLVSVRHISPLHSLRVSDEGEQWWKDSLRWWIYVLIFLFVFLFARLQLDGWMQTIAFTLAVAFIFVLLYVVARGFTWLVRRFFPTRWSYLWRQGLSNLYRPNNQTVVLLVAVGFGTALIATLFFVQDILLQRVSRASAENSANMVLFDVQPTQRDSIRLFADDAGIRMEDDVPIVTMQLQAINGRGISDFMADTMENSSTRAFRGEIRATYRDSLTSAEKLVEGNWIGQVDAGQLGQVSLDQSYAQDIHVEVGDTLSFNVQGAYIDAVVSSFREVDWNRFQSNFRVVFAKGTIDRAPQFYLMMAEVKEEQESIAFQQAVVSSFPNVSVIDMNAVLEVLQDLLAQMAYVIQFIGAFSILTGVVVLIASVRISKYQRIRENVLLRTLGASRRQIFSITISEYFFLGLLAAVTGMVIALLVSTLLAVLVFEGVFVPSLGFTVTLVGLVTLLTVVIGLLNSLSAVNRSPLEALRKE